ncbi:MAG: nucleotidyltransferase substrate binding protein [Sulfurovum sp.]|nr:nucleotidyltransferase substrate binding protein [Sulfurovum sp.]
MALEKKLSDLNNALQRLQEAFEQSKLHENGATYTFFRDSTIQRFEFTLEITWKTIKTFLQEHEGIACRSPKGCMREFFSSGHLTEDEVTTLLMMIDDRNLATHTYHEALAEQIFTHIQTYLPLLQKIYKLLKETIQ